MAFKQINVTDAKELIKNNKVTLIDIRDKDAYNASHIENAQHVDDSCVAKFLLEADMDQALIVCCYHGHSSQGAAEYMSEKGFDEVYSLQGGFTAWQQEQ